ncbi:MAG TPA: methionyl-tRNA formyltransferase [Clostridiales bacterium]|nr:methionyl-tRNA formyltransferase [Clostridiales bacterium]
MALVKKFERLDKQRNSVHEEVDCTYSIFTDSFGNKFLQIDTYGSKNRRIRGKVSQSLQLNKESAKELKVIITNQLLN